MKISQAGRSLLRQTIEQFSELFLLELFAQFHDRQWDYLCPHSSLFQGLEIFMVLHRKFSQLSLTWLSLGSVSWFHRHSLSISLIWIHLCRGCLWLSVRFWLLIQGSDWLEEVVPEELLLNRSDESFVVDCIIFRYLVHSNICTSRRAFRPKNVSYVLVNFYHLLCVFSPEELETSAVVAWDSDLKKHRSYVGW